MVDLSEGSIPPRLRDFFDGLRRGYKEEGEGRYVVLFEAADGLMLRQHARPRFHHYNRARRIFSNAKWRACVYDSKLDAIVLSNRKPLYGSSEKTTNP